MIICDFVISICNGLLPALTIFLLSKGYQRYMQKIENDRIMKELFREFNERFDNINNKLLKITKMTEAEYFLLKPSKKLKYDSIVMDFFNICSEEYFWYKEKRINMQIWKSWHKGMNDIYDKSKVIQDLWAEETKNKGFISYYLKSEKDFFEKA